MLNLNLACAKRNDIHLVAEVSVPLNKKGRFIDAFMRACDGIVIRELHAITVRCKVVDDEQIAKLRDNLTTQYEAAGYTDIKIRRVGD